MVEGLVGISDLTFLSELVIFIQFRRKIVFAFQESIESNVWFQQPHQVLPKSVICINILIEDIFVIFYLWKLMTGSVLAWCYLKRFIKRQ